jgi:hypothetical protein
VATAPVVDTQRRRSALRELRAVSRSGAALAESFDAGDVAVFEAVSAWEAADRLERAGAAIKTMLAAKVEEAGAWKARGYRSAAEQLARLGGTSVAVARETLETSKSLTALPETQAALQRGDVSVTQARAIASAAVVDASAETRLIQLAGKTNLNELRDACLKTRAAADPDPDATYERIRRQRHGRDYTDGEGAWNLHLRGPADQGSKIMTALEPGIDAAFERARAEGRHESRDAYVWDALVALADGAPDGAAKKKPKPRYYGLLRVDVEALRRGAIEGEEVCEIAGVGSIPVRVARQLLGESILKLVVTKGVDVANVVHLGRGPTAAQRVALMWQQPNCTNVACSSAYVQIDHRKPFADKQETVLKNLDPLCPHCHRLKTNCGWLLVEGTGPRDFVPPTDPRHPNNKPPP